VTGVQTCALPIFPPNLYYYCYYFIHSLCTYNFNFNIILVYEV
jgi:hypothetical protein